jgi:hypothetical protein
VIALLNDRGAELVAEAADLLKRCHLTHYEAEGDQVGRSRLERLFVLLEEGVQSGSAFATVAYARELARERFYGGFDLSEVQTAVNALEEVVWKAVMRDVHPDQVGDALARVSTILGMAKDALAREYASLAGETGSRAVDCRVLFRGLGA